MKLIPGAHAIDFEAQQIDGTIFKLSQYQGSKILLSFFRHGACAMCNLRIHELITHYDKFEQSKIKIVAVFESSIEDMVPYVAQQHPPFTLLADPEGKIYSTYGVESSEEKINYVIQNNIAEEQIKKAAEIGFPLTKQAGSNFYRLPADFLIDKDFTVLNAHYSNVLIDHLSIDQSSPPVALCLALHSNFSK